jgi:hypothetical protein
MAFSKIDDNFFLEFRSSLMASEALIMLSKTRLDFLEIRIRNHS